MEVPHKWPGLGKVMRLQAMLRLTGMSDMYWWIDGRVLSYRQLSRKQKKERWESYREYLRDNMREVK